MLLQGGERNTRVPNPQSYIGFSDPLALRGNLYCTPRSGCIYLSDSLRYIVGYSNMFYGRKDPWPGLLSPNYLEKRGWMPQTRHQ